MKHNNHYKTMQRICLYVGYYGTKAYYMLWLSDYTCVRVIGRLANEG